ncbi:MULTISPECIES: efflux RND transporter periplasmic adaptor subunit [Rhizobium]|uniref:Efflux RND transporter periplasmic adaptor subunit n=1 Tax=Rhizobium rhododendri TaxID=2506430 RepID=A0ABY8INV8_9HYPH|nr:MULTISPECIES: efflux RND transporter periplasmic adaptor subunit [Rhizobium]MBO9099559.1 efflux RND transporter periplasmic adaptor subunit [Rhizobium sp. L58/93]MBO9170971.1 efflux RND transporter periplasmic adaptor subunit [Rhizobium sp. L245/93]MBO9186872.1 efflux RND transporter periplasmic adaptor subunit [Rhizobium sp. E27B/91]MBZ5762614.1 efflux RND transporter periplasmic adaptor subunit [Rhizobium sp. VS19-DR96]MBZ5768092.1 efflux RND transporter periplasmic adaptor subunit [Rhizo
MNFRHYVLPILGLAMLTSCEKQEAHQEPIRPVLSIVAKSSEASTLSLPGTVEARIETQLAFRVLGRVIARNVSVGDLVKKGDVVAAIDPISLELAVRSAQSDLANSQATLANAASSQERQRALAASKSGSQESLDEAVQAYKSAIAGVGKSQASLDKAQEQLGYAKLHAEFDGVVTATSAEVGQVVSAGSSVVTIARPDQRDAVIDIPEASFGKLTVGAPFQVALQLDPTVVAKGVIREVAPEAESLTRTSRTKITLIDPPDAFRIGSVITASATIPSQPFIVLPSSAILLKDDKPNVWLVDTAAAKVSLHPVTLDGPVVDGGSVKVTGGINPGARVVVAGVHKLSDGQAVRIDQGENP